MEIMTDVLVYLIGVLCGLIVGYIGHRHNRKELLEAGAHWYRQFLRARNICYAAVAVSEGKGGAGKKIGHMRKEIRRAFDA